MSTSIRERYNDSFITKRLTNVQNNKISDFKLSNFLSPRPIAAPHRVFTSYSRTRKNFSSPLGSKTFNESNTKLRNQELKSQLWVGLFDKFKNKAEKFSRSRKSPPLDLQQSVWGMQFLDSEKYLVKPSNDPDIEYLSRSKESNPFSSPSRSNSPVSPKSPKIPSKKTKLSFSKIFARKSQSKKLNIGRKNRINNLKDGKRLFKYSNAYISPTMISQRVEEIVGDRVR
mmetsp:Transcript_13208/g.11689  ORF Transcript_13208/g.11689 Transcript_13208/m.11689 type:complete len:228 (-) Transcript_13208:48-731(-)